MDVVSTQINPVIERYQKVETDLAADQSKLDYISPSPSQASFDHPKNQDLGYSTFCQVIAIYHHP
jgi:hypothetical protein